MGAEELEAALNKATRVPGARPRRMRFGGPAKHAVFFGARDEARSLGDDHVGGEHILIALLGEEQGLAACVLRSFGITPERVRSLVGGPRGADDWPERLDHDAEAQSAVELAQAEAQALGRERVESGHVLLALLGQGEGAAVRVVSGLGREPQQLRERLLAEIEAGHDDYEGFSMAAREVVALAEDEARQLDHAHVGTEHLLLGLLSTGSVASQALEARGITRRRVRDAVLRGATAVGEAPGGPIPLADHARRALERARAEARAFGSCVNPEHELLGLAGEAGGLGASLLLGLDGDPDELRKDVVRRLSASAGGRGSGFFERFTEGAAQVVILAQEEARLLEHDHIGSGHILLGLLREGENAAAAALAELGLPIERVREQVARVVSGPNRPPPALLPLGAGAQAVFELARRDAEWLGHDRIGTEHIVLAIWREDDAAAARMLDGLAVDGVAGRVLDALSVSRDPLRARALMTLGASWASGLSPAEEELSRKEQWLREAEARFREATSDRERGERAAIVDITRGIVDRSRRTASGGLPGSAPAPRRGCHRGVAEGAAPSRGRGTSPLVSRPLRDEHPRAATRRAAPPSTGARGEPDTRPPWRARGRRRARKRSVLARFLTSCSRAPRMSTARPPRLAEP